MGIAHAMCKPKTPKMSVTAPLPPSEAPKALALPDGGLSLTASSLRLGSRNNLAARQKTGTAPGSALSL